MNGQFDIEMPLYENINVIVGPNGSGKSTFLQILALALGKNWSRLAEMRFRSVTFEIDGEIYSISNAASRMKSERPLGQSRFFSTWQKRLKELDLLDSFQEANLATADEFRKYYEILNAPRSQIVSLQNWIYSNNKRDELSDLNKFERKLIEMHYPKVLYLPTYRRVELELEKIFHSNDEFDSNDFRLHLNRGARGGYFEEIIRFGMEDVQDSIFQLENRIRDFARNKFNNLMSSFLKDMANNRDISVRELRERGVDQSRIDRVLTRIQEGILNDDERGRIVDTVKKYTLEKSVGAPKFHEKWLSYFFVKLMDVDSEIAEAELPLSTLATKLQKYLEAKSVQYESERYHFSISDEGRVGGDVSEIDLSSLSSGEKQLLSLLSIVEFGEKKSLSVLIDEPELSLSVPWQSDFLPDVVSSRACSQLIAVTHSPFIYENLPTASVVDFMECRR